MARRSQSDGSADNPQVSETENTMILSHSTRTGREHLAAPKQYDVSTLHKTHKKLLIRDLEVGKVHFWGYLLLRVVCGHDKFTATVSEVMDEEGNTIRLAMYNYISPSKFSQMEVNWLYYPYNKVILLEPFLKLTQSGEIMIRCDNPSHAIWMIDGQQAAFPAAQGLPKMKHPPLQETEDPHRCKEFGNEFFKDGIFFLAAEFYTKGLQMMAAKVEARTMPDYQQLLVTLLSNKSEALLKLNHPRQALAHARLALQVDPSHVKSILRRIRAQIDLGQFRAASDTANRAVDTVGDNKALCVLRQSLARRLTPVTAAEQIDFAGMLEDSSSHPCGEVRILWPDYIGPLKPSEEAKKCGRGKGMYATEQIEAGTVLLCEKAKVVVYMEDVESDNKDSLFGIFQFMDQNARVAMGAFEAEFRWKLATMCHSCDTLNRVVEDLYYGRMEEDSVPELAPSDNLNVPVDVTHIETVEQRYGMACSTIQQLKPGAPHRQDFGLWSRTACFNNSCVPNCFNFQLGDMMVVCATKDIPAGTELTISYCGLLETHTKRTDAFKAFGFQCCCPRCEKEAPVSNLYDLYNNQLADIVRQFPCERVEQNQRLLKDAKNLEKAISKLSPAPPELLVRVRNLMSMVLGQMGKKEASVKMSEATVEAFRYGSDGDFLPHPVVVSRIVQLVHELQALGKHEQAGEYLLCGLSLARRLFCRSDVLVKYVHE